MIIGMSLPKAWLTRRQGLEQAQSEMDKLSGNALNALVALGKEAKGCFDAVALAKCSSTATETIADLTPPAYRQNPLLREEILQCGQ